MKRSVLYIPLLIFLGFALIGAIGFFLKDPHQLPSALLNKPFPEFSATDFSGKKISRRDLTGEIVLINVWATWCPTCLAEHAELLRITRETGLPIIGINYKDNKPAAQQWLNRYGDPYQFNIQDIDGQLGVELGVYGAPESFLLNSEGVIVYKRVGEINDRIWKAEIMPVLQKLAQ